MPTSKLSPVTLIGCDPEIFISTSGKQDSAHSYLPGTKHTPYPVKNGAIQVDGTACEFNIEPAATPSEFDANIVSVLSQMENMIKVKSPSTKFTWIPARVYNAKVWKVIPDTAKEMGCDPDFNAYTGHENPRPGEDGGVDESLRSCGGHIHIGWTKDADIDDPNHLMDCRLIVAALDFHLYPLSVLWDTDTKRRQLYGKPGAFRPKSYGVEYRVLSNMWVKSKETRLLVAEIVQGIVGDFRNGGKLSSKTVDSFHSILSVLKNGASMEGAMRSYSHYFSGALARNYFGDNPLSGSFIIKARKIFPETAMNRRPFDI